MFLHLSALARLSVPSSPCASWKILVSFYFLLSYHDTPRPRKLFSLFGCYCASASSSRSFVWRDVGCGACRHSVLLISTDGACRLHPSPSPPFHAYAEGTEPMVAFFFLQLFLRWLEDSCAVGDGVPWSNDVEWKGRRVHVKVSSVDASTRAGIVSDVPCTCRTSTCDGAVHSASKRRPTTNQGVSSLFREETLHGHDPPWVSSWGVVPFPIDTWWARISMDGSRSSRSFAVRFRSWRGTHRSVLAALRDFSTCEDDDTRCPTRERSKSARAAKAKETVRNERASVAEGGEEKQIQNRSHGRR